MTSASWQSGVMVQCPAIMLLQRDLGRDGPWLPFRSVRYAWHQIRLTVAGMSYAARRVVELQAPWAVDAQWHAR
jgi:hypothetical protein